MYIRKKFDKRNAGRAISHVKIEAGNVTFVRVDRTECQVPSSLTWRKRLLAMLYDSGLRIRKCREGHGIIVNIRKQW